jgi:hypothetical protein
MIEVTQSTLAIDARMCAFEAPDSVISAQHNSSLMASKQPSFQSKPSLRTRQQHYKAVPSVCNIIDK